MKLLRISTISIFYGVLISSRLKVDARFSINPDPFAFGEDDPNCDTEMFVMDSDGIEGGFTDSTPKLGSMVVGGFTMSK